MLAAFSIDELLEGFGYLTLGIFVLVIFFRRLGGVALGEQIPLRGGIAGLAVAVGGLITQAVGIAGLALWVLDVTQAWRPVWRVLGLDQLVFPDLNGRWSGTILSNGPQLGYKDLCQGAGSGPAPATCTSSDPARFACLPVEVKVSMTLVKTDLELSLCNLHSHSSAVSLTRRTGTYDAKFAYQFEVPAQPPTSNDAGAFLGSAILEVDSKRSMHGYYWTDRNWREGRQTAGYVTLNP